MNSKFSDENAGRRPLKTRQWALFQQLATVLTCSGISANAVSVASFIAAAVAGGCLAATAYVSTDLVRRMLWLAAAICIQLRLVGNLLDGMVAVEGGKRSPVGDLYNEVPDRLSDSVILVGSGFASGGNPVLGLTAALVAVFVAYVRAIGVGAGVGQVFIGPFAKPQRMALMTAACLACAVLPVCCQPIRAGTVIGLMGATLGVLIVGSAITAIRRLQVIAARVRARAELQESHRGTEDC